MDTQQQDLSYFRLRLQELLKTSFPEKANDQKFIEQRSSWAANAYESAFNSGNTIEQCNEIANYILFQGLHFSKFDVVFQVVFNEFDTLMSDEELCPFALVMLSQCETVFGPFDLDPDFAATPEFKLLYRELTVVVGLRDRRK